MTKTIALVAGARPNGRAAERTVEILERELVAASRTRIAA